MARVTSGGALCQWKTARSIPCARSASSAPTAAPCGAWSATGRSQRDASRSRRSRRARPRARSAAASALPSSEYHGSPTSLEGRADAAALRSEEHTSELQSHHDLVCRLLLEKKKKKNLHSTTTRTV